MMKRTIAIACVVATILLGNLPVTVIAVPLLTSNYGKDYYVSVPDLKQWSCGLYLDSMERKLDNPVEFTSGAKLSYQRNMGYIGYDFFPCMTTYATVGTGTLKIGNNAPTSDNCAQYGVGVHFNLLDKDILDPTLEEDKIRVTAGMEYIASNPDFDPFGNGLDKQNISFDELSGSIVVSLVNDIEGNKSFLPFSLSVFAGLLYSDLITNVHNLKTDGQVGFTAGLEIFYTESVSFFLAVQNIGDSGYTAGVNLRF